MAQDFGPGVSRTLSARDRQFQVVVWQPGKPPLDSELNLMMQADWERHAEEVRSSMPSGWLLDPFNADQDFKTQKNWANFFEVGGGTALPALWANVNGWIVPVTGTATGTSRNRVHLFPPPSSDSRVDFVFLEVWLAQVAPNPSALNKPSPSTLYKYGNTKFGGVNLPDDLEDPAIGFETTERVQLQYRIRVVGKGTGLGDSVDLSTFPDGLDDPNVLAQGSAASPQAGWTWQNMGTLLGDSGLWRAGNGNSNNDLGTVDGYAYAIPLCAVFRRNSGAFVARTSGGNANQNGALNRNPIGMAIIDPSEAARVFTPVTLTSALSESVALPATVQVNGLANSGLDNPNLNWSNTFLQLGEEVIQISGVNTGVTPGTITIIARGRNGTQVCPHEAGTSVEFFVFRPDGLTADGIAPGDILDLRRGVTRGEWDYQSLLLHNLGKLFNNTLRSSYKQAFGSDTQGPTLLGVDTLWADGAFAVPAQTTALDGPDGIRYVFSDAAVPQEASLILNPTTGSPGSAVSVTDYTAGAGGWDPAAGFQPDGFQPDGGGWSDGAVIRLYIGGTGSGANAGARLTVRTASDNRFVRFLTPKEYWLSRDEISTRASSLGRQTPFMLRFLAESWGEPAAGSESSANHPGPMFPLPEHNFERPFLVLGGIVNPLLREGSATTSSASSTTSGLDEIVFPGLDFDVAGDWYPASGPQSLQTEGVTNLLLWGQRNLFDMLTAGGKDLTGASSELYVVLTGDSTNPANCGAFRVVGAGTIGFTGEIASAPDRLVVERVGVGAGLVGSATVVAEVRSQYTHTQDNDVASQAAAVIVLTDLASSAGGASSPWFGLTTGALPTSQAVLDTAILYGPSRGAPSRVPDRLDRLAWVSGTSSLVREAPTTFDPTFPAAAGVPSGEVYFPVDSPVQLWSRLTSLGLPAPLAPEYGGKSILGEEQREAEVFTDPGSKTLVLRPLQRGDFTLYRNQIAAGRLFPDQYTLGASAGIDVDPVPRIFTLSADFGYAYPWEYMPRFGRQDIPFRKATGTAGPVYYGINHMFGDSLTPSDDVFRVVGGPNNSAAVQSMFFVTGASTGYVYGQYGAVGTASAFQARIYVNVNVQSSDVPRGLKGIQLPPFMGIARLYGVYDKREFSGLGAWAPDRVTPQSGGGRPKNLLRTDLDKQTLYIVQGGAADVTGNEGDHTYVIPSEIIDPRRSGQYVTGETFDDLEYVVECVIFGFARGFINENNYILARRNLPTGASGTAVAPIAPAVSCIAPLPAKYNDQLYLAYTRTPYQGDPYMTRNGATKTTSDYAPRLGQIPSSGAFGLATPLPQFDSTAGFAQVPQIPNARSLEILASADFYTTLGTGKVGGPVYPGTPLDVGHLTNQGGAPGRIPPSGGAPIWQSESRTFTQGALPSDPKARGGIVVLQDTTTSAGEGIRFERGSQSFTLVSDTDFSGASPSLAAASLAAAINANLQVRNVAGVYATWNGGQGVSLGSLLPGGEGNRTLVAVLPAVGSRGAAGFALSDSGPSSVGWGLTANRSPLSGGEDSPTVGARTASAQTPVRMAGLTERLPLGILLQDADFLGEDPLRDGNSSLCVIASGGSVGASETIPVGAAGEWGRSQGAGQIGMADGSILQYQAATGSPPSGGALSFRLFRGGGSAWVLDPEPSGGPVDWSAGSFPTGSHPVLKGAVLAGRAFLVRNWEEEAYAGDQTRSWGGELQMVVLTEGIVGSGPGCRTGYALSGKIGPTGWGEGFAAADRYRLEGKPMFQGHSREPISPDVPLAPLSGDDDTTPPCP
jgi:hypothetical protein